MTEQCTKCNGSGILESIHQECPDCKGSGKPKSLDLTKMTEKDLGNLMQGGGKCQRCGGLGKITIENKCQTCGGRGEILNCQVCGKTLGPESDGELCVACAKKPLVHKLSPACDTSDLEIGKIYEGDVDSLANFGAFVNLNASTRGLVHQKNITRSPEAGDQIFVVVKSIASNGNIDLVPANLTEYQIIQVEKDIPRIQISALNENVGKLVHISGEVIQVKQTGGPTIFTIADETGTVPSAAFEKAG